MLWVLLIVIAIAVVVYKMRVQILAKLLGQPEARVQRALNRRKGQR